MDSRLLFGLGVSFIFGFARWRFPAVPKPLATFGAVVGLGLIVWAAYPAFNWEWAAPIIGIAAVILTVLDAMLIRPNAPAETETVTAIDQSVTSHGQSGGITARNVGAEDVGK